MAVACITSIPKAKRPPPEGFSHYSPKLPGQYESCLGKTHYITDVTQHAGPDLASGRDRLCAFLGEPSSANPGATQGRALRTPHHVPRVWPGSVGPDLVSGRELPVCLLRERGLIQSQALPKSCRPRNINYNITTTPNGIASSALRPPCKQPRWNRVFYFWILWTPKTASPPPPPRHPAAPPPRQPRTAKFPPLPPFVPLRLPPLSPRWRFETSAK
jgi:hypothetical protein